MTVFSIIMKVLSAMVWLCILALIIIFFVAALRSGKEVFLNKKTNSQDKHKRKISFIKNIILFISAICLGILIRTWNIMDFPWEIAKDLSHENPLGIVVVLFVVVLLLIYEGFSSFNKVRKNKF